MELEERINIEDFDDTTSKIRLIESENEQKASFTHYLHNHKNGVSQFYKKDAIEHVKDVLEKKYPENKISHQSAEEALQYLLYDFKNSVPFPEPKIQKFKFIDLFAGIGGFRLALQNLGGKCVFTSEWDKYSKRTYQANFGEVPFGDITKPETKSYIPDGFDVLCAGFPCQAFSIAGKRGGFEDTRGTLFFDVAEIIKKKQPKAIFLENVKGLRSHDRGKTLSTILNVLREDLNYYVPEPQVINAKEFGVPQNRERIFIVGFRKDLGISEFQYPEPIDEKVVLEDILEEDEVSVKYYLSTTYIDTLRKHRARHESKGNGFGYEIIPNDGIANAVVCGGMGRERNLILDDKLTNFKPVTKISGEVNREGIRKMTPREWARLQGFPDEFKIVVSDQQAYKQFGNSVAVPAIQATAEKIIEKLSCK
ncbi:DNA cytosine methyltransferase [Arenibacter sp. ARW7G5Y1]|uniref:DNA cytosine methyltransferase n=1 Tax=Arenibacter sp. ARW7G5Y1 TaxID=2135619 RepID=UPI000D752E3A|nr:DNA cytosine methyltransferase [Arenibacter sp. ARW7G5Y1]PXX25157.1 DNA (cytosine-5)-methyltransferase 1 [Arenibacter sp. ARW7G5Y1]